MNEAEEQMQIWELAHSRKERWIVGVFLMLPVVAFAVGWFVVDSLERGAPSLVPSLLAIIALALVPYFFRLMNHRPRIELRDGELRIDRLNNLGMRRPKSMSIGEIQAVLELPTEQGLADYELPQPKLVVVDGDGDVHRFFRRMFRGRKQYREFREAIAASLEKQGKLEKAETRGREMKAHGEEYLSRRTPVSIAVAGALLVIFIIQSVVQGWQSSGYGNFRHFSELQLLDAGGISVEALLTGDWHRLMTAALIHSHTFEVLGLAAVIVASGLSMERYLGGWRTAVILIVGAVVGNGAAAFVALPYIVVGAWGAAYALFGASAFLYFFRRSGLVIADRMAGRRHILVNEIAAFSLFLSVILLVPSLVLVAATAGSVVGFAVTWALLARGKSPEPATTVGHRIVAISLTATFVVGLVGGTHHVLRAEQQEDRLRWISHSVEQLSDAESRERRNYFRSLYARVAYLDGGQQRELVRHAIDMADFSLKTIDLGLLDHRERRNDAMCVFREPEERLWHEMYLDALPPEAADRYMERIMWECEQKDDVQSPVLSE